VKHLLTLILISLPFILFAQANSTTDSTAKHATKASIRRQKNLEKREHINQLLKNDEEGALIYRKEGDFGFKFNTDGFSCMYEHGKYKTITKTNMWWLELGERKSQKQKRFTPDPQQISVPGGEVYSLGNSYIYGKENNFYFLNLGFGKQRLIGNKGNTNGVAVSAIYGAGLTLGLLKPYYVQVPDSINGEKDIKFSQDSTTFLDATSILGASGFSKGLGEIKVVPGLHTRVALRFDYGKFRETISALEVGLNVNYYANKIGIMALNEKERLYLNAYAAIFFGRRK